MYYVYLEDCSRRYFTDLQSLREWVYPFIEKDRDYQIKVFDDADNQIGEIFALADGIYWGKDRMCSVILKNGQIAKGCTVITDCAPGKQPNFYWHGNGFLKLEIARAAAVCWLIREKKTYSEITLDIEGKDVLERICKDSKRRAFFASHDNGNSWYKINKNSRLGDKRYQDTTGNVNEVLRRHKKVGGDV